MKLLEGGRDFKWIDVAPNDITNLVAQPDRGVSAVWEEDTGTIYEISYRAIWDTLEMYRSQPGTPIEKYPYFATWLERKGRQYCEQRVQDLFRLYESMKQKGFKETAHPFSVAMTTNGEKLDGSHRAVVAQFLGIPKIRVKEYSFAWEDLDADYIDRRTRAMKLSKPNYYFIDYGGATNMDSPRPVYKENSYDRWEVLKDLIHGDFVLDLGCNEGFMSLQCALQGRSVVGIDHDFIEGANTNKLFYEIQNKKELSAHFIEGKIQDFDGVYSTALLLNVIYHLPKEDVMPLMKKLRASAKVVIMQGNLRKIHEHDNFWGITRGDMKMMLEDAGFKTRVIEWRDKPIVIGT